MPNLDRRTFLLAAGGSLLAGPARAELDRRFAGHQGAFVLYDVQRDAYERYHPERCRRRFPPQSTRKIAEGLIGLETGVIPDSDHFFKWDGVRHGIEAHNRNHSLRTALAASTNWYFERVDQAVGQPELNRRLQELGYGNGRLGSGKALYGEDELRVSADEQVAFLQRLYHGTLPLSRRSLHALRDVMLVASTPKGVLRGKTGTGGRTRDGKPRRPDSEMVATLGWFVGWVEHSGNAWIFAANITGGDNPTGNKARQIIEAVLNSRGLL